MKVKIGIISSLISIAIICCTLGACETDPITSSTAVSTVTSDTVSLISSEEVSTSSLTGSSSKSKTSSKKENTVTSKTETVKSDKEIDFGTTVTNITAVSKSDYHYASNLSGNLLRAYNILKTAAATRSVGMISLGNISASEARLVYTAVKNDYPEYFWLSNAYVVSTAPSGQTRIALELENKDSPKYLVSSDERYTMSSELKKVLRSIRTEITKLAKTKTLTEDDLERFVYDWLCENVTYNDDATKNADSYPLAFTAYGALVQGSAVCEGYARAAQLLFNMLGIKNILVTGQSAGSGHMWNIVCIGGNWYHFDATWADSESEFAPYAFFYNMSDSEILRDRTIDPTLASDMSNVEGDWNYAIPKCPNTGTAYSDENYSLINGEKNISNQISEALASAIQNNQTVGNRYYDFAFAKGTDDTIAKSSAKQLNYKTIIENANRLSRKNTDICIGDYQVTVCESGAFRIEFKTVLR